MATISTHNGSTAHRAHNIRAKSVTDKLEHIDTTRPHEIWVDHNIRDFYNELFGESVSAYNAKQTRPERRIKSYYSQLVESKKQHPVYEMICGVYQDGLSDNQCRDILLEFVNGWKDRNPNLALAGVYYHADEQGRAPHIHIDYVPVAHGYKRGLETQAGLAKALGEQGFHGTDRRNTAQIMWEARENQVLEQICQQHGLQIEHPEAGSGAQHLDTPTYIAAKRREEEAIARCAALQQQEQKAADDLLRASESLQDARNELDRVQGTVDALSASEDNLRRSMASLAEECDALRRSTASPDAVDAAERAAKPAFLQPDRVILPKPVYELLLTTSQASAINRKEAVAARAEASKAKQEAENTAKYCKSLQDELARIKPAAEIGKWFAYEHEQMPFHTIASSWGMKIARLVCRVLGKPLPEQQQPAKSLDLTSQLSKAGEIAAERNHGHQTGLENSRKRDGREH